MEQLQSQLINADCFEYIKNLEDDSIDLILTSPPYNLGKSYEEKVELEDYVNSMEPLISEMVRVLKSSGSICWQVGNFVANSEVFPLDIYFYPLFKKYGLKLRNRIIWHYSAGLHCYKRFSGRYETILWFTKADEYTFNLDDVRIPSKYPGKKYYKGDKKGRISSNPKGKNPEDVWKLTIEKLEDDWDSLVWDIPNIRHRHPEKVNHPCQFPVELVERCVLALTNQGDVVYDPFAGVASTVIGSVKNGRIGIGTEISEDYVNIGIERLRLLEAGELKLRPMTQKVYEPRPTFKVAQMPKPEEY